MRAARTGAALGAALLDEWQRVRHAVVVRSVRRRRRFDQRGAALGRRGARCDAAMRDRRAAQRSFAALPPPSPRGGTGGALTNAAQWHAGAVGRGWAAALDRRRGVFDS
ncbi:MAG: hypothetical protein NZ701_09965 [Roseiflexus sp.]|nr:hypothetical protein [Roseiflexus sp.]